MSALQRSAMQRWTLLVAVLLVPIVPFFLVHDAMEQWVARWVADPPAWPWVVTLVVGLLATDVFLPVPSSLVSTLAGSQLPGWLAALSSWMGLNLGAGLGYLLSWRWGRSLVGQHADGELTEQLDQWGPRHAELLLVLTRGVPVLAEATVLWMGSHRLAARRFWPVVLLSNLGLALAYAYLGRWAADHEWLPLALAVSLGLPLALLAWVRWRNSQRGRNAG